MTLQTLTSAVVVLARTQRRVTTGLMDTHVLAWMATQTPCVKLVRVISLLFNLLCTARPVGMYLGVAFIGPALYGFRSHTGVVSVVSVISVVSAAIL